MAGARQPIELVVANGKKHLTKAEIEARRASEVQPCTDDLTAPSYLTAAQKKKFVKLAEQLTKIGIMGETDTDLLARYVTAQSQYETATKELRALQKQKPREPSDNADAETCANYLHSLGIWLACKDNLDKQQDRYFKQAQAAASKLGLTISDRCKLVVPAAATAEPKRNKFSAFGMAAGGDGE